MIQRQSDSFSRFAHSSTLLSTFLLFSFSLSPFLSSFPSISRCSRGIRGLECKAKGRGSRMTEEEEESEWRRRTTRKATILSRDAHSTHECARLQKRIPGENARDVLRPSYVRKLKS